MLDRVAEIISRYSMLACGQRLGIAVSGGADSVCLLHVFRGLAAEWDLALTVLHLNHQLRGPESDADAAFVTEMAKSMNLPVIVETEDVGASFDNLEQAGRQARLAFFRRWRRNGLDRIATGHTVSDQAETVLFRLLRGSGTAGLSGILPVTAEGLIRPLLMCTRPEIEDYLHTRSILWREDRTNQNPAFVRNRIRHQLLPALQAQYNPALPQTLAQLAVLAQDEEEHWANQVAPLAEKLLHRQPPAILIETTRLLRQPPSLQRRLLRRAAAEVKGDLRGIGFQHIEALKDLAAGGEGHGRVQIPGLDIFRSFEWLRIGPPRTESRADRDYELPLQVPGRTPIPGAVTAVQIESLEKSGMPPLDSSDRDYNTGRCELDGDRVSGPLSLRNWRPGDRYACAGYAEQKVKLLFQQARVPIWERQGWPIITSGEQIIWARKFGPAAEFVPGATTRRILTVVEVGNVT